MRKPVILGNILKQQLGSKRPSSKIKFAALFQAVFFMLAIGLAVFNGSGNALPTNTFSGTLTDSDNQPIKFATIRLNSASNSGMDTTDASGNFSMPVVPDIYKIRLQCPDPGDYVNEHLDGCDIEQTSATIDLTGGNQIQDLQLQTADIQVTVKDYTNTPVSGAAVSAKSLTTGAGGGSTSLYTGDVGEAIYQVRSGTNNDVFTNGSGIANITTIIGTNYGTTFADGSICAVVSGGNVCLPSGMTVTGDDSITLTQPTPHVFSGTLTDSDDQPLQYIDVKLASAAGATGTDTTDAYGNFSISVAPDTYKLSLLCPGGGTYYAHHLVNCDLRQSTAGIDLTSGNVIEDLKLQLATIEVTVVDSDGNFLSGINVSSKHKSSSGGTTSLYTGDPGETIFAGSAGINSDVSTNSDGVALLTAIVGENFDTAYANGSICANISSTQHCIPSNRTISGDTRVVIVERQVCEE